MNEIEAILLERSLVLLFHFLLFKRSVFVLSLLISVILFSIILFESRLASGYFGLCLVLNILRLCYFFFCYFRVALLFLLFERYFYCL